MASYSGELFPHIYWQDYLQYDYLDGVAHTLNATVFGARAAGWGDVLMTQFQIDSVNSSTITAYLDDLTIYRW